MSVGRRLLTVGERGRGGEGQLGGRTVLVAAVKDNRALRVLRSFERRLTKTTRNLP